MRSEWSNFVGGLWESEINVRDFIQKNYKPRSIKKLRAEMGDVK